MSSQLRATWTAHNKSLIPDHATDTTTRGVLTQVAISFSIHGIDIPARETPEGLSIVATPIGHLGDISLRALGTLAAVDLILCEDTRISRRLMSHYGISTPLSPYHDHNGAQVRPHLLARLQAGETMALISDAGTPLISDPGYKLVQTVQELGVSVSVLPGASSVLAALAGSGLATDRFLFLGFPPVKPAALRTFFTEYAPVPATLILFESAKRAKATLAVAMAVLGERREAALARELTKVHEEIIRAPLADLVTQMGDAQLRGEVVLLFGPPTDKDDLSEAELDLLLQDALHRLPPSRAAAEVARLTKGNRRALFQRALALNEAAAKTRV